MLGLRRFINTGCLRRHRMELRIIHSICYKITYIFINRFKQDDIVIEYLGETIRSVLADYREKAYKERGFGDCYMFKACPDRIIDATFKGNEARYLNHSCNVRKTFIIHSSNYSLITFL